MRNRTLYYIAAVTLFATASPGFAPTMVTTTTPLLSSIQRVIASRLIAVGRVEVNSHGFRSQRDPHHSAG